MKVFLETERLVLHYFTENDAETLFELDRDPEVMRYINGGKPTDYRDIQKSLLPRILNYYEKYTFLGIWAVTEKSSNQFICWLHFIPALEHSFMVELKLVNEGEIALGYRLRKSSWGKGYATEGSRLLISKGFTEWGVQRVVAWALTANKASIRVMENAGLKFDKEFIFAESQLPHLQPDERKAIIYALNKDEFKTFDRAG